MDFHNKVVLITGAGSGIGEATALHFAKLSAKLSLVDRNVEKLEKVAQSCEGAKGIKPLSIVADLTIDEQVNDIVSKTVQHWGQLFLLVNNAGICKHGSILSEDIIEQYDQILANNLRPVVILTKFAVPHLIKSKGNIVNVSSISSTKQLPGILAYSVAKAGLDQFTKCVALELASKGVRANLVNPGSVITNIFQGMGLNDQQVDEVFKQFEKDVPLKRSIDAEEIAELIAYLASDKARSITGSSHVIDGGSMMNLNVSWTDNLK